MTTRTSFSDEKAPCGKSVDGYRNSDRDDDGRRVEHVHYSCGCQDRRDDFYDGSVHTKVIHHNGKVLVDDQIRGE